MLKLEAVDFQPLTKKLEDFDVTVTVRRATLADESKRMASLFSEEDTALITDIATVETWVTLIECDIVDQDENPLLAPGMDRETFSKNLTVIWQHSSELFWALHAVVREANPQWAPSDSEGNE